jgi:MtrB/PioB family decaheme-associated outer membrane protein
MKCLQGRFAERLSVIAVHAALATVATVTFAPHAFAADASDDDVRELTTRASQVEVGIMGVDKSSAKFGEYNGLDKRGAYGIANFQLYGPNPDDIALRWKLIGTNLGLDNRALQGEVGAQGKWRLGFSYDELTRNASDSYQTLWLGGGSSALTLPSAYPAAATRFAVTNTAGGILANWNNIQSPNATATSVGDGPGYIIPGLMRTLDIGSERRRSSVGGSVALSPQWELSFSAKQEDRTGTKLIGVNIGRFSGVSSILPEPLSSTTHQFDVSLAFKGEKGHFSLGYYGSIFKNDINLWTVQNAGANNAVMNNVALLSGAPDNQMHQLNVSGTYKFSPLTRVVVTGSTARLTQNEAFIAAPAGSTWVIPVSSADAKVNNTFLQAKLTSRVMSRLNLNASYKYEDRDNKTPIHSYLTTGGDSPGTSTQFTNEPLNRRLQQVNLDADYTLGRGQAIRAEFERQDIRRTARGEETPFRADKTHENTVRLEYRNSLAENLTGRLSYSYSQRRVSEYEEGNPRPTNPPSPLPAADPLLTGFEQFFLADRNRTKLRSSLNYDASENLSLQAGLDYNKDGYENSPFGLKKSESWVLNLDGTLVVNDKLSFNGFYTQEDMKVRLESLAIARGLTTTTLVPHVSGPPCAAYTNVANTLPADYFTDPCRQWSQVQADKINTFGLGFKYKGLLAGKLELQGDVSYSRAKSPISVTGGTYYNNGVPNSATGNGYIAAQSFPDITSEMTDLRLTGTYTIDKASGVRLSYIYRRLKSADWAYDAYTNSPLGVLAVQNFLGPGITSPNYTVQVVGVSYIYRFR